MAKKKVILTFPPALIEEPVTYNLIKNYDCQINILKATVRPKEKGRLVIELNGSKEAVNRGLQYLKEIGVQVEPLAQEVRHLKERCTSCSACIPHCPTAALSIDRAEMKVSFRRERCILCEACLPVCAYKAMEIEF
ncbi:MAG: 4Fe-4S dicluster domain-containing protein [Deltaproteobacteria bacterium]|nr:4Fe-4S dicluster domain-containing protein [Deltaproteobacteria bacterium]